MRKIKLSKPWRIAHISLGCLLVLIPIIIFLIKDMLMDKAIAKVQAKLKNKYNIELTFRDYALEGLSHVRLDGICCRTQNNDSLLYFEQVTVDVKLLPMLIGKLRLENIKAHHGMVDAGKVKDIKSSSSASEDEEIESGDTSKFQKARKYLGYLRDLAAMMPDDFIADDLKLKYHDTADYVKVHISSMTYKNEEMLCRMRMLLNGKSQDWTIKGKFDRSSLETDVTLTAATQAFYNLSLIKKLAKADIGFRQVHFRLDALEDDDDKIEMKGSMGGEKVFVYNPRLTSDTVEVQNGALDFNMRLTPEQIILDSISSVTMNQVKAGIGAMYQYEGHEKVSLKINMPPVDAQALINSFPGGTFQTVKDMRMSGKFGYKLNFYLDMYRKDTIDINSDLEGYDLKILSYGESNIDKLNGSFTYYPYNSKRPIIVGMENPNFTRLEDISPYLKNAVLTSEDPSFYSHKGFVEEAFEQSFLKNVKEGAFRRGGSTISMQLVKNVFLSHKKTIERKVEEAFIVWLIENMRLVSKSRMLEVYFNVIEWGPNVYGIGEAAPFYFSTTPYNLDLNECIFLANIIPQPLGFQWRFDKYGVIKEYMQQRMELISRIMARRRLITSEDTANFTPNIFVSGPARKYMKIEPLPQDSTILHQQEDDFDWRDILDFR